MSGTGDWSSRRLHFVGIGGAGMSGLALVAKQLGADVGGSDRAESTYTDQLRRHGIEVLVEQCGYADADVDRLAEAGVFGDVEV